MPAETNQVTLDNPEPVIVACPHHIRPCPARDDSGRWTGKHIAIGVECRGTGQPLIAGRFCRDADCQRDMTYKLKDGA
jgi:hypothetical protein